jgi:hypothetical protein
MASPAAAQSSPNLAQLFDLNLGSPSARGSAPLSINTALPSPTGNTNYGMDERYGDDETGLYTPSPGALPSPTGNTDYSMQSLDEQYFDAVGEVETQPLHSAREVGMLTQSTEAGLITIQPNARRGFGLRDEGEEAPTLTELEALFNRQRPTPGLVLREPQTPVVAEDTSLGVSPSELPAHVRKQHTQAEKARQDALKKMQQKRVGSVVKAGVTGADLLAGASKLKKPKAVASKKKTDEGIFGHLKDRLNARRRGMMEEED